MVIWGLAAGTENYICNKSISWALYKAPEIKQKNQSRFSNLIKKQTMTSEKNTIEYLSQGTNFGWYQDLS